jgi:type IV pilus assembly protein PilE
MKKKLSNSGITPRRKVVALSLNEVLVVLIIIGILVLLALPRLMPLISKAKATEAQLQLNHLYTLEKSYFYTYSKYTDDFNQLGFEQETLSADGGNANYLIEVIESSQEGFRARATSVVDFDGDGVFNVWEINEDKQLIEINKD